MTERMSAAEYRQLAAGKAPKRASKRGAESGGDGYPRTCIVCGERVLVSMPAQMHTDVATGAMTTRHLECKAAG